MHPREAKDFLVQQTVRQAEIEGVSLSDLERRMMYFTEGTDAREDPTQLNQEFEAEFDSHRYERKISALMHHAYKRNKGENPEAIREWDRSIRCLRRGDHYILVMWGGNSRFTILFVLAVSILYLLVIFIFKWIGRNVRPINPHLLMALFVAIIVFCVFFPRRLESIFDWVLKQTLDRFLDSNGKGKEST